MHAIINKPLVERLEHHSLYVGLDGHTNNAVTSNLLAEAAAALRAPEAADAGAVACRDCGHALDVEHILSHARSCNDCSPEFGDPRAPTAAGIAAPPYETLELAKRAVERRGIVPTAQQIDKLAADLVECCEEGRPAPPAALHHIAQQIRGWLKWDREHRRSGNLTTDDNTAIMSLPVPFWPSHGQFERWIEALEASPPAASADAVRERLVEYLRNLPIGHLTIGGQLTPVVQPQYLLATDRDALAAALSAPVAGADASPAQADMREAARRLLDALTADGDPPAILIPEGVDANDFTQRFDALARALAVPQKD